MAPTWFVIDQAEKVRAVVSDHDSAAAAVQPLGWGASVRYRSPGRLHIVWLSGREWVAETLENCAQVIRHRSALIDRRLDAGEV